MIALPILIPLACAVLSILSWKNIFLQRALAVFGTLALVVSALQLLQSVRMVGVIAIQVGNWQPPFGISLVVDVFSAIMLLTVAVIAFAVSLYGQAGIDLRRVRHGYYPLFHFLMMGVNGAFISGDLFNLYVWFEVMLMASFVLITFGGEKQSIEGGVKYVILNLLASVLFLAAIGLIYNLTGTLNMADLAQQLRIIGDSQKITLVAMLFFIAFGIKAAAFPLFFWLPASYHTPPVSIAALFAGLLTKVGVYALVRTFTLLFTQNIAYTHTVILIVSGFTMTSGVLGAMAQTDFRRLLSFHIISQIGYLLMGLGLMSVESLTATIFFTVHNMLAKTSLFLVSGLVEQLQGSFDLKKLGGLYASHVWLALLFALPAMSLAGIPPLSGFVAKLGLVQAGFNEKQYLIIAVSLVVSIMTLFSMTKVWNEVFWKPAVYPVVKKPLSAWMIGGTACLVFISLSLGLLPAPLLSLASQAATLLMHPDSYIQVTLGGMP